jgi:hypothetical protein
MSMHLQDLGNDRSAAAVVRYADDFINDSYHELIITGARVLLRIGLKQFEYVAGYSNSTLWSDASGENFISVRGDGTIVGYN